LNGRQCHVHARRRLAAGGFTYTVSDARHLGGGTSRSTWHR
jgi:hypothetical protein